MDVISIGDAAAALGVSRSTVQKMVDGGDLDGVRTHGGHRRILRDSVTRYLAAQRHRSPPEDAARALRVLIAEDNSVMQQSYRTQLTRRSLDLELSFAGDAIEALLAIERERPHVVIADLVMSPFDGFHLISTLRGKPEFADIAVVVVTALNADDIQARGGLPPSVPVYTKPAPWERLAGYLQAQRQLRLGAQLDHDWRQRQPTNH